MRNIGLVFVSGLLLSGCIVEHSHGPGPGPVIPQAGGSGTYHVLAGGSAEIPGGDLGFVITANGQGGYRLAYTDTLGSASEFSGHVTTDGTFDERQLSSLSGSQSFTLTAPNRIDFASIPGANIDGFDLVSSTDPVYVEARVNGFETGFDILFAEAPDGAVVTSSFNPVAFTSP
jgi:hypothetical protein